MKSLLLLLIILVEGSFGYRVVCVYTNWSQYRPDGGKFLPEDVDASLCTHLIYVYAKLKGNKLEPTEWNDEGSSWSEGMYGRVNNLKQLNPELKTLLGVGGWMMGSKDFSKLAAGRIARKIFAKTTAKFLRDRNFDGLTIDWQHPTKRGGKPKDKTNFSLLLQEIRKAFEAESRKSGLPRLLLTTGVSASRNIIEEGYEIDNITKYTDFINVMAYDLHGAWDNYTGHPSQLYAREEEFGPSTEINVDASMRYWMSNVPDRSKLNLGVSTYGRTFTLRKARHNEYNVPTTGPGVAGEFTQQPGMLAYYERCSQYADARRVWDAPSQVAYWYSGNQWIAGEDTESVKAKVNWMRFNNIGGIMLSSLDMDDFTGMFCTGENYPLLNTIHNQLIAPLPKTPRLRTNERPKIKPIDITRKPYTLPTTEVIPTFQTTYFLYDTTTYETTTELTTATAKSNHGNEHSKKSLKQIGNIIIMDRKNVEATQMKNNHQPGRQGKTATDEYFESLASRNNPLPNTRIRSKIQGTKLAKNPPSVPSKQIEVTTVSQVQKMTKQKPTPSSLPNISEQESELRNFLKKAADLPSHRLINGIMKLLGQGGQTKDRTVKGKEIFRHASASKAATPTIATVATTTVPPIRTHKNEPDMLIPDLRTSALANKNNKRLFTNTREINQPLININREIISGNKKNDRLTNAQLNRNNVFAFAREPVNEKVGISTLPKVKTSETQKRKQLVPPPFPLPNGKEVRPSKRFLDMKDLGFLSQ
ncbi:chitotriosidase-1-like isoform X2 [Mercenaria mercenaria]|uniref:chitotriosidase-1-like isoform X2 n=1 Tax=Mercenaria mercenaria TaxID=6596 RepID=UPI00234E5754|nr:chitotriosidase-1-like isoform X2 [Mercenaria mercenaria]